MAKAVVKKPKETGKIQYEHLFKLTVLDKTSNRRETYYAIIRSDKKWGAARRATPRELLASTTRLYDKDERPLGYVDRKQLSLAVNKPEFAMYRIVKGVYAGTRPVGGERRVKSDAVPDYRPPKPKFVPPERDAVGTVKLGKVKVRRARPKRRKPRPREKVHRIKTPFVVDLRKKAAPERRAARRRRRPKVKHIITLGESRVVRKRERVVEADRPFTITRPKERVVKAKEAITVIIREKPAKKRAPKRKPKKESLVFAPDVVTRSKRSLRKDAEIARRKTRKPAPKRKPRRRKAPPKRKPAPSREKRKTALAALRRKAREAARRAAARRKANAAARAALAGVRRSKTRLGTGPSSDDALKGAKVGTTARRSRRVKAPKPGRIVKPSATGKIAKTTTPKPKARPKYAMAGLDMPRERVPTAPKSRRVRLPRGVRGKGTATSPLRMSINLGGGKNIAYDGKIRSEMRLVHFSANVTFSPEKYSADMVASEITRQLFRSMRAMKLEKVDFKPVKDRIAKSLRRANIQMRLWK